MQKPTMKRKIGIESVNENSHYIIFCTDKETAKNFREFGRLAPHHSDEKFWLDVDARYDFDEVLRYIREFELE